MSQSCRIIAVVTLSVSCAAVLANIEIETVTVGNPGNVADDQMQSPGHGAVIHSFNMAKYEVTAGQYAEFLNAVAQTDAYGLYNDEMWSNTFGCKIERSGESGGYVYSVAPDWADRPVNYVSWGDAARFANWLHNGQPIGDQDLLTTENGSYFLNGAIDDTSLMQVRRALDATWALPTDDEWYKAAYHKNDGVTGNYFDYPTASDTEPSWQLLDPDPGNNATFRNMPDETLGPPYYRTVVGAHENSASPYGTFDQGGNVVEWNETALYQFSRCLRGGMFTLHCYFMGAWTSTSAPPTSESYDLGFRVAEILWGPPPAVDMNCDRSVDVFDIDAFVLAITEPAQYETEFPDCSVDIADCNNDGYVDVFDIDAFVAIIVGA
ncbi:MAG: SUMF1/EgtB/PvdO family nonheme iron enzyme [Phycisphaerae bacterium]|nr:SUMF1/EgtB/PvdO family nonheme iron enzyme [Phycisphaerae bacterium]